MSEQGQSELIAKLKSQHKQRQIELNTLRARAMGIARELARLAEQLGRAPEFAVFCGQTFDSRFSSHQPCFGDYPDTKTVKDLCHQIREIVLELEGLDEQKNKLGI